MMIDRRAFLGVSAAAIFGGKGIPELGSGATAQMYGLIGKIVAVEGRREELAEILLEGAGGMPGCMSYVVALDTEDEDALWVTEVWETEARHRESLARPSVQEAIGKGRPLIRELGERFVTTPIGGHGLE